MIACDPEIIAEEVSLSVSLFSTLLPISPPELNFLVLFYINNKKSMPVNKRPSIVNFPIPFDHPYTLPTLAIALAASSCVYYYLQSSHRADLIEAVRQRDIGKRRHLNRPEDRYASLKVHFLLYSAVSEGPFFF